MYLILAIASLIASLAFYWRGEHSRKIAPSKASFNEDDAISLDEDDIRTEEASALGINYLVAWLVSMAAAVGFFAAYFNTGGLVKAHRLKITYEEFSAYMLGNRLAEHFDDSTASSPVRTVIVVSDPENPYVISLVTQLQKGLGAGRFHVLESVSLGEGSATNPIMTSADLHRVIDAHKRVELVISLVGFVPVEGTPWQQGRRPYIAVYSDTAAFNDNITLINHGLVDLAMISMGRFEAHSLIPQKIPLQTTLEDNFIMVHTANVYQVVQDYKQTVTAVSAME